MKNEDISFANQKIRNEKRSINEQIDKSIYVFKKTTMIKTLNDFRIKKYIPNFDL